MINKRLILLVPDSMRYIRGNVISQWLGLLANIAMMLNITGFVGNLYYERTEHKDFLGLAIVGVIAIIVRAVCSATSSRMSYLSSKKVKESCMFWDYVAGVYDIFANVINRKTHKGLQGKIADEISEGDTVLECACGTGLLSGVIADRCKHLVATDYSSQMLKRAGKKHKAHDNIEFLPGNILHIEYQDESFDVVVAANVIHLLDEPYKALKELERVCRKGGKIMIPTYMNNNDKGKTNGFARTIGKAGANFKNQFTYETYQEFIHTAGYLNTEFFLIDGKIPCALAIIRK